MPPASKFQVLAAFRPLVRSLTIYNTENFGRSNGKRVVIENSLRTIGFTALYCSLVGGLMLNFWSYMKVDQTLTEAALHLVATLCTLHQLFIFATMTVKNQKIVDALNQLQRIVENCESILLG